MLPLELQNDDVISCLLAKKALKELLNAVRRPLTQYTVLKCVSHFNSVAAKREVAEKMTRL